MYPDEIKVGRCYSMRPVNGRRIIVKVIKLFDIATGVAGSADVKNGSTESPTMKSTMVRFVWRHAAYPTGWSTGQQQLLLAYFAPAAEEEVARS
jgi:hypothetical protein